MGIDRLNWGTIWDELLPKGSRIDGIIQEIMGEITRRRGRPEKELAGKLDWLATLGAKEFGGDGL